MSGLADIRDVVRGAVASFFGFGGRLIARALLMVLAGRVYGIEALGVLGQVAAITEISAAVGVIGLKRGLLDQLSYESENGRSVEARIVEALGLALAFAVGISILLLFAWPLVLSDGRIAAFLFFAVPVIVFTEIALTAVKYKRIIRWDVWARGIAEPWGFLLFASLVYFAFGASEAGLVLAYVGSIFAGGALAAIGLLNTYGLAGLAKSKPSLKKSLAIPQRSAAVALTDIGVMALRRLDLIVMSLFVGPSGAGLYYMVQQLASVPQKVNALFEPMMSPVIARLHNRMDGEKIRNNLVGVCRWIFIIQLAITIPIIAFGDIILSVFGAEFAAGGVVLAIVLTAELLDGAFITTETPLVFANPKIPPLLLVTTLIIEVAAIAVFTILWGVEGAAAGFFVAIAALTVGRLFMLYRNFRINVVTNRYIGPLFYGVAVLTALLLLRRWIEPDQSIIIISAILGGTAAFLYLIKTFALTKSDRVLFRAVTQRRQKLASP